MKNTLWTPRDLDIVETLSRRVRTLTLHQIVLIWWPSRNNGGPARRRMRKLTEAGLIEAKSIEFPIVHCPVKPVHKWSPGIENQFPQINPSAPTGQNSGSAQTVFYATKLAANLFGTNICGLPEKHRHTHEAALAAVYSTFRTHRSDDAVKWTICFQLDGVSADAWLIDQECKPALAIKLCRSMSPGRIKSAHDRFAAASVSYELW